eukprot:TRINITY_DN77502_c0_g1_i1.p1 TRINITY_DN77502_c0_g1~~TRINITY_DN77502_c0_g1_i1.p1  ORF type:complete len:149 (-),score=21.16 TRINITY_DN77502_c0_g1_i1:115-561(-)
MESWRLLSAAFHERDAFEAVRSEVHTEVREGGRRFSDRQRELISWQQVDFVPTFAGIVGGCGGIHFIRKFGFWAKSHRLMVLLPAIPCYVLPYQAMYYFREARYLTEMMREDKSSKYSRYLRRVFEDAAPRDSAVLEELEAGAEIGDN